MLGRFALYAGLLLFGPATALATNGPTSATPLNSPATWVTTNDYPAGALRQRVEGTSAFTVTISPQGKVINCLVTQSSGSEALDKATCDVVTMRATFIPATGASGEPIEGAFSSRMRWVIPQTSDDNMIAALATQPGELSVSYLVDESGKLRDCKVEKAVGPIAKEFTAELGPVGTSGPCSETVTAPVVRKNGKAVAQRFRLTLKVEAVDSP